MEKNGMVAEGVTPPADNTRPEDPAFRRFSHCEQKVAAAARMASVANEVIAADQVIPLRLVAPTK